MYSICMRTTLNLPENLITEAQKITKTKTEVIIIALEKIIKLKKLKIIKVK